MGKNVDCIFFAEFDNTMGPKVTYQAPEGFISGEVFDAISECIIPKPRLFGRMVSTCAFGKTYLGLPICIEEIAVYEPVVRKIARTVEMLEIETGFLSDENLKSKLQGILTTILTGIQERSTAVVPIDEANTLYLLLFARPTSKPVPQVHEHDVPVPICSLSRAVSEESNLVLERILPYVDGIRFVKLIADAADVDVDLTVQSVQCLVDKDLVRLVDIFQFSNIYAVTSNLGRFAKEKQLRDLCLSTVLDPFPPGEDSFVLASEIFALYAALRPGLRFSDFCLRHERQLKGVNKRRFITFGLVNKLIRRVRPYPLYIPLPEENPESTLSQLMTNMDLLSECDSRLNTFELSLMNGSKSLDEVCCTVARVPAEIDRAVAAHTRCILVYK